VVLRDHAFAFRGGEHRCTDTFRKFHEIGRCSCPKDAEAGEQHRPLRQCEHIEGGFQVRAIGTRVQNIRYERRLDRIVACLPRRFALRQFEMHWPGRHGRGGSDRAPDLLANCAGVNGRAPFHDRRIDCELIDALAQADLVSRPRIAIRDRDKRSTVKEGVGDAVDHVCGAGTTGR